MKDAFIHELCAREVIQVSMISTLDITALNLKQHNLTFTKRSWNHNVSLSWRWYIWYNPPILATKYKIQFNVLQNIRKLLSCTFMINCNKQRCHCSSQNSNTHTHASSHGGCQHQSSIQIQGGSRIFCPFANLLRCRNSKLTPFKGNENIQGCKNYQAYLRVKLAKEINNQ